MLYDLSKHYHVFEKKRMEALERFKGDEDMTNWLYEFEKGVYETSLNFEHTLRDWFGIEHVQEFDNFNKYRLSNHSKILFPIEFKSDYGYAIIISKFYINIQRL